MDDLTIVSAQPDAATRKAAIERIASFAQEFGETHLMLACHAAFPLAITPDLLYHIWANFVSQTPWIAVADLLLSRLCHEVGYELYEMDVVVRNLLLQELRENFGQRRLDDLADFLTDYVRQQLRNDDPDVRDLAQAQRWAALAYTQPGKAVRELAETFAELISDYGKKLEQDDRTELIRIASLVETFAGSLSEFGPLLVYARGMTTLIRGDLRSAVEQFDEGFAGRRSVQVAGVRLPIPQQVIEVAITPQIQPFPPHFVQAFSRPIAVACHAFNKASTDTERFSALDWLINNLVKYLTAIALSQYWHDKPDEKQLRRWLAELSQAHLRTSLTVFNQIAAHYTVIKDKPYLFSVLFEPSTIPVDYESPIAEAYKLLRHMQRRRQIQEEISPQTYLVRLLTYRERRWEANVSHIDQSIQDKFLPALRLALEQLITIFSPLLSYPLRYIDRVDGDGQDWVYTTIEFPGAMEKPSISEVLFREHNVKKPSYQRHRLYLCTLEGLPKLNLHPFLIAHLYKLYFLEQADDRTNIWYQHCASPERYHPPEFYNDYLTEMEEMEESDDVVDQLEQVTNQLEEDENRYRIDKMPFPVLLPHLSVEGRQALEFALGEALRIGRFWLGVEFLLIGLSKQADCIFFKLLREIGIHPGELRGALRGMVGVVKSEKDRWRKQNVAALGAEALPQLREADPDQLRQTLATGDDSTPIITPRILVILKEAAKMAGEDQVGHVHLLTATFRHHRSLALQFFFSMAHQANWSPEQVISRLAELAEVKPEDLGDIQETHDLSDALSLRPQPGPTLAEFGRDLIAVAQAGNLHPAEGETARQAMAQLGRILLQRQANNPILVGDPGVGKTAIVEGFAWRLAGGGKGVVKQLAKRRVIELSATTLTAGTKYRGQLEERLQQLVTEVKAADGQIIVFIDEIHSILKEGSTGGLADAIKPALARGEFPCIGATTVAEYRQHIEKDAALARRFTPVWLEEPNLEEAIEVVGKVATGHLAEYHNTTFAPEAIETAVRLSARYLHDERLPGKAIKLLDQAASGLIIGGALSGEPGDPSMVIGGTVTVDAILEVIADRTNIPIEQLGKTDKERLLELESRLKGRIIGQIEAIDRVVRVVKRAGAGLTDPRRPQGVFLFAGPTGVGKTELALALTEALFDNEEAIFRLDMSEFMEKHQVVRLIGAPPGYVGYEIEGQLTGRLRRRPYSVIFLDGIEKAHPDVQHLFLQLFDYGRLTDSQGRLADGRNAIFIMTTNLGAKEALRFADIAKSYQEKLLAAIHDHFTMEFINRIDRIVYFNPLDEKALSAIFDRELLPFQQKLKAEKGIEIMVSPDLKQQFVQQIIQQELGTRPLRRFIEDKIIAPIVDKLLAGEIESGQLLLGPEIDLGSIHLPPDSSPGGAGQAPFSFDPGNLDLRGTGPPFRRSPEPKRPITPEEGLPHLDNVDDEHQTAFDERFLELARQLQTRNIALEITDFAKNFLCAPYNQSLRGDLSPEQAFEELIKNPLTDRILIEEFQVDDWIRVDRKFEKIIIEKLEVPAPPSPKTKRPVTPEDGLPHLDNVDVEHQTGFDDRFLELARKLQTGNITLEITDFAKNFFCAPYNQSLRGGLPPEQAFEELIDTPLTAQLLTNDFQDGDWIRVDRKFEEIVIEKVEGTE